MELRVSKINGTNNHLDYEKLVDSLKSKLEPICSQAELVVLNRFPVEDINEIINKVFNK